MNIVEKSGGSVTSTKQFIWCGIRPCEERDGNNAVTKRFFDEGQEVNGGKRFYTRDHLGSVREMTGHGGAVRARYEYDAYGRRTKVAGDWEADFGFTGHYYHAPSGLHLAMYRAYDADIGRWINRDPIEEAGGLNLYAYVNNDPFNFIDPLGLISEAELARLAEEARKAEQALLREMEVQKRLMRSIQMLEERMAGLDPNSSKYEAEAWKDRLNRNLGRSECMREQKAARYVQTQTDYRKALQNANNPWWKKALKGAGAVLLRISGTLIIIFPGQVPPDPSEMPMT